MFIEFANRQAYLKSIISQPGETLADVADWLRLTTTNSLVRRTLVTAALFVPLTMALVALPECVEIRQKLQDDFGPRIVALAFSNPAAIIACLITLLVALIVNRGWARTEQERERLVITRSSSAPPADMRGSAFLAAVTLILLTPILIFNLGKMSCSLGPRDCVFPESKAAQVSWPIAADVAIQSLTFSIPQEVLQYPNFSSLEPIGASGRVVMIIIRLFVQIVFVGCIFELVRINRTVNFAVDELRQLKEKKPRPLESAQALLGSRMVPKLCRAVRSSLRDADENSPANTFLHNAANALGQIGDPFAIPTLKRLFRSDKTLYWPRQRAASALAALATVLQDRKYSLTLGPWYRVVLLRLRCWSWLRLRFPAMFPPNSPGIVTALRNVLGATGGWWR